MRTLAVTAVGPVRIEAVAGDITTLSVDAVVNAANDHLWMGAGVAGAIKRRGGEEIEREAVSKGPIPVGTAVETGAGELDARYVIHAAVMGQELTTDLATVVRTTRSVLELSERLELTSVALPLLATGVGGLDPHQVAREMAREASSMARSGRCSCMRVLLVGYGEEAGEAVRQAVEAL